MSVAGKFAMVSVDDIHQQGVLLSNVECRTFNVQVVDVRGKKKEWSIHQEQKENKSGKTKKKTGPIKFLV